jgi:hypothetical protein
MGTGSCGFEYRMVVGWSGTLYFYEIQFTSNGTTTAYSLE